MTLTEKSHADALRAMLGVARENEKRWMEMSPEFSQGIERMEQWADTARRRRFEVERVEALLVRLELQTEVPQSDFRETSATK